MFTISKSFHFDYSHRVWVQKLREDFCAAGDSGTKCRFIHGHTGCVKIWVEGSELNPQSMLCDFKELGFAKDFFDNNIDHKFIIDRNDPLFDNIVNGHIKLGTKTVEKGKSDECPVAERDEKHQFHIKDVEVLNISNSRSLELIPVYMPNTKHLTGYNLDVSGLEGTEREYYESFFIVNFVPTSENLARWVFEWAQAMLSQINVKVSKISWSETPKSIAVYTESGIYYSEE